MRRTRRRQADGDSPTAAASALLVIRAWRRRRVRIRRSSSSSACMHKIPIFRRLYLKLRDNSAVHISKWRNIEDNVRYLSPRREIWSRHFASKPVRAASASTSMSSEERSVGKEWVSTSRTRWSAGHRKKQKKNSSSNYY